MKMFEYMALGKPIISSDLPVLREVRRDRENALLVPPNSAGDWIAAVSQLRGDPALRERLSRRVRIDAETYPLRSRARKVIEGVIQNIFLAPPQHCHMSW